MSRWMVLRGFLRSRRWWIALFVLQALLLFLVSGLYGLPMAPICYTALLMGAVWLIFAAVDLLDYAQETRRLECIRKQAQDYLEEQPASPDLHARLTAETLNRLEQRCQKISQQASREDATATQYYTLWSHQAKTPLAAMRLLLQEKQPDRALLGQELFKAERYVDMALQYQRLSAPSNDLVLRDYPLEEIVKLAVKDVSTLFIHKKIGIELGNLEGTVLTDQKWLLFVVEQLLGNAVKYTPAGRVTVWCEEQTLFVRDTGIGISAQDLPRVFEWGYTGYNGHGETRSTGIGLSLCKKALTMLGHDITITSQVGQGTTVAVDLAREPLEAV